MKTGVSDEWQHPVEVDAAVKKLRSSACLIGGMI